jgi:hypothetical protein
MSDKPVGRRRWFVGHLRRVAINLSLAVGAVGVATLLCEGAIRWLAPQVTFYPRYVESEEYPIMLPPNARIIHSQGRLWRFEYTTNAEGHRGRDGYGSPRSSSTSRIVSLGDSFTFGIGVDDGDVYTSVLEEALGPSVEVINGGMSGWGLDSEIKWFFRRGVEFRPEVVTLQFTMNDPYDTSNHRVTRIEDGEFVFSGDNRRRPWWQLLLSRSSIIQKSHLYVMARGTYDRFRAREARSEAPPPAPDAPDSLETLYGGLLSLFAERLDSLGPRLLFLSVTHPHGDSIYHYDLDHFPIIGAEVEELRDQGLLEIVDLPLDEMRRHPGSPEGHQWSATHHRLVGMALADAVQAGSAP